MVQALTALVLAAPEKGSAKVAATTHAPHPAWLHMALVPVSRSVSRRKLSRLVEADSAAVSTVVAWAQFNRHFEFWVQNRVQNRAKFWDNFTLKFRHVMSQNSKHDFGQVLGQILG